MVRVPVQPTAAWRDYFAITALTAASGSSGVLVPLILTDRGYSPGQIGPLVAALGIAALVSRLPIGSVYQPSRARWLLAVSVILAGGVNLLYPLVVGWPERLLLVRVVNGLAEGTATTVNLAAFLDSLPPGVARARGMSLYAGGMAAGFTIGNLVGGLAVDAFGYQVAFGLSAALWLVALVQGVAAPRAAATRPAVVAGPLGGRARLLAALSAARDPQVLSVNVMAFALNGLHHLHSTFFPVLAVGAGLSAAQIGVIRAAHSGINAVARPLAAPLLVRMGGGRAAVVACVTQGSLVALVPVAAYGGFVGFLSVLLGIGGARAVGTVANQVSLADIPETRLSRGLAAGLFNASKDLGNIAGPLIGSALAPLIGLERMFVVGPIVLIALFAVVARLPRAAVHGPSVS